MDLRSIRIFIRGDKETEGVLIWNQNVSEDYA